MTYAELSLTRPSSLEPLKNGGGGGGGGGQFRAGDNPTIYAQIDHDRRPARKASPLVSPASVFPQAKQGLYHREVVTVRTPLMGCQQESCV